MRRGGTMTAEAYSLEKEATSKTLFVYERLKARIVHNELKPQEYLNEQALCQEYGVSKTPVREALQMLAHNRLVVIVPSKGCYVSNISVDLIREVFEVREIYECAAARIAASMPTRTGFADILENHDSFKEVGDQEIRASLLSGYQIHEHIVNAAGNSFLSEYYSAILDHILRIRIYFLGRFNSKRLSEISLEHKEILAAILRGDPDEAEKAMKEHLERSLLSINQLVLANRRGI
jgi:DNA-binding GntR family transcriptional regulator